MVYFLYFNNGQVYGSYFNNGQAYGLFFLMVRSMV